MDSKSGSNAEDKSQPRGFVSDVVLNAFEPGVNRSVLLFLNIVFILLLLTLVALCFVTGLNFHFAFLLVLTVGLMIALNL